MMLDLELFDVWGIDFIGPFVSSYAHKYNLVAVDNVTKWMKALALADNEGKSGSVLEKEHFCPVWYSSHNYQ